MKRMLKKLVSIAYYLKRYSDILYRGDVDIDNLL